MESTRILLVEDDKDDQYFFIDALKTIEKVTLYDIANNGKEAIEKLDSYDVLPDIIFMDINMPLMNGAECLTEIAKRPRISKIPVIILATSTDAGEFFKKLGAKAIIKKPNDRKELCRQLQLMLTDWA